MTVTTLYTSYCPTNPKPQITISTGSSYVLDELYQGECIQIGGTRENNSLQNLVTNLYIKSFDNEGVIKFVHVQICDPTYKIVLSPCLHNLAWDVENMQFVFADFDTFIGTYLYHEEPNSMSFQPSEVGMLNFSYNNSSNSVCLPYLDNVLNGLQNCTKINVSVIDEIVPTYSYWNEYFSNIGYD